MSYICVEQTYPVFCSSYNKCRQLNDSLLTIPTALTHLHVRGALGRIRFSMFVDFVLAVSLWRQRPRIPRSRNSPNTQWVAMFSRLAASFGCRIASCRDHTYDIRTRTRRVNAADVHRWSLSSILELTPRSVPFLACFLGLMEI